MNRRLAELVVICVAALVLPAILGRTLIGKAPFDRTPLRQLQAKPPSYAFIGDSMCRSRIDMERFEQLTGEPVGDLVQNGSASARWYLFFKNYLVASGTRPKMTFLFFRDTGLTDALHRTGGKYRRELEEGMLENEPVVDRLLSPQSRTSAVSGLDRFLGWAYPVQTRQTAVREVIEERLLRIASFTVTRDGLRERVNDTFALENLRGDVASDLASAEEHEVRTFDPSPDASFLPHIIELGRQHHLPICFVRVKRSEAREEEWLQPYIRDLRAYLTSNGAAYYDEGEDPEITAEMFGDGDHVDRKYRTFVTERFYSRIKGLVQ